MIRLQLPPVPRERPSGWRTRPGCVFSAVRCGYDHRGAVREELQDDISLATRAPACGRKHEHIRVPGLGDPALRAAKRPDTRGRKLLVEAAVDAQADPFLARQAFARNSGRGLTCSVRTDQDPPRVAAAARCDRQHAAESLGGLGPELAPRGPTWATGSRLRPCRRGESGLLGERRRASSWLRPHQAALRPPWA